MTGEGAYVDDVTIKLEPVTHIQVDFPKQGDELFDTQQYDIRWRSMGDLGLGHVEIELYKGLQLTSTISPYTANDGLFSWTVPLSITGATNYQIRVGNTSDPSRWGWSPFFEIADTPSVTVVMPNGDQSWARGETKTIVWSWTGYLGPYVNIAALRGTAVHTIANATPNDGWFEWEIPVSLPLGTNYRVRIRSASNTQISDTSNETFEIRDPTIIVTRPRTGDYWPRDTEYYIAWDTEGNPGPYVDIGLYRQTGRIPVLEYMITTQTENTNSYLWNIPITQETGSDYRIRVQSTSDTSFSDYSDIFTILEGPDIRILSPNGGEWIERGTTWPITWRHSLSRGRPLPVKLDLYRYSDWIDFLQPVFDHTIVESTAGDGEYIWEVPDNLSTQWSYTIKITSTGDELTYDWCDHSFRITAPRIFVIGPNFDDLWLLGTSRTLVWDATDLPPGDVLIELFENPDVAVTPTLSLVVPNTGWHVVEIPDPFPVGPYNVLKISSVLNPDYYGRSEGMFVIGTPGLKVTSPEAGDVLKVGTRHRIMWEQLAMPNSEALIELYKGFDVHSRITTASLPFDEEAFWPIPPSLPMGYDYRIKITSQWDESYFDFSDYFGIEPQTAANGARWPLY
jgi:hypothetical protein